MAKKDHEVTIATSDGQVRTLRATEREARDYERLFETSSNILWVEVKTPRRGH
jgi:hypothetical protein